MIDFDINYSKITEHLSSFVAGRLRPKTIEECSGDKSVSTRLEEDLNGKAEENQNVLEERKLPLSKNEQEFKIRLSSFEYSLWTCTEISPLTCVSYGWYLNEKDILQCVTCNAIVCSTLPPPNKHEAYAKFVGILNDQLRTGHKDWCGWPSNPSPSDYFHPPLRITLQYINKLIIESKQILTLDVDLPYFDTEEIIKKLGVEENHLSLFYEHQSKPSNAGLITALLVLCGWSFDTSEKLKCDLCLRSVGVWNFLPLKNEEEFLKLLDRNREKALKKQKKEANRREKERKQKVKEDVRISRLKAAEEAEEAARKLEEEANMVKQAMEKISRMEKQGEDYESDSPESSDDEEMSEVELNNLLTEDTTSSDAEDKGNVESLAERDFTKMETDSKQSSIEDVEETQGFEDGCSNQAPEESEYINDGDREDKEGSLQSEDEEADSRQNSEDELWLEAVGGYDQASDDNNGTSDSVDRKDHPRLTDEVRSENKKRPRDSDDESDSNEPSEDDVEKKPSKLLRIELESAPLTIDEGVPAANQADGEPGSNEDTREEKECDSRTSESDEEEESESEDEDKEEDEKFQNMKKSIFDPLTQHRHWCGWIVDCSSFVLDEEKTEIIPGYKILPPQLKNILPEGPTSNLAISEKYVRNIEGLRAVRNIIDSWTVPESMEDEEEE